MLAPGCSAAGEYIHGTRINAVDVVVIETGPDQNGVAGERDAVAEQVDRCAIGSGELGLLGPGSSGAGEYIHRARIDTVNIAVVRIGRYNCGVAFDRDSDAKPVAVRAVGGGEPGLLTPGSSGAGEHIRRTRFEAVGVVVIKTNSNQCGIAGYSDAIPKLIALPAVGGEKLCLLDE